MAEYEEMRKAEREKDEEEIRQLRLRRVSNSMSWWWWWWWWWSNSTSWWWWWWSNSTSWWWWWWWSNSMSWWWWWWSNSMSWWWWWWSNSTSWWWWWWWSNSCKFIIKIRKSKCLCNTLLFFKFLESFSHQITLMVFHWSLSDNKSPQVSRTLLSILAILNNAVVWMVSTRPPTSKSSSPFSNPLVTVPKRTNYDWYNCHHVP